MAKGPHPTPMFYSGKKVLVTSGASFIGRHLADQLLAQGAEVGLVDDLSSGPLKSLEQCMKSIEFIEGEI